MSGGGDIPRMSQKTDDSGIPRNHTESFCRAPIQTLNRRSPGLLPLLRTAQVCASGQAALFGRQGARPAESLGRRDSVSRFGVARRAQAASPGLKRGMDGRRAGRTLASAGGKSQWRVNPKWSGRIKVCAE
jgi:hypothetical protein